MKKKFLSFIFAICLLLPCAFMMTACGGDPPPDNPPPPSGASVSVGSDLREVYFLGADATSIDQQEGFDDGRYSIWIADFYDKDTLQVLIDGEPIVLSYCETPGYENKNIGPNVRKIATFTVPTFTEGDHTVTCTVDEEELDIKFVSNGQEFTDEEMAVLSDWYLPTENNIEIADIIDTDFVLSVEYSQLAEPTQNPNDVWGIPYACKKDMGYYKDINIFRAVDPEIAAGNQYVEGTGNYDYTFMVRPFEGINGFSSREIELTLWKENLVESQFSLRGRNAFTRIFSYVDGETEIDKQVANYSWKSDNENDIKVYIEPYPNVDLSNVEVYIYDTMMDLEVDTDKNQKYFTIPSGSLPISYSDNPKSLSIYETQEYFVTINNVDVSNADFITHATATTNDSEVDGYIEAVRYFISEDDVTYYIPGQASASYSFAGHIAVPTTLKFNGTSFDLSDYVYKNTSVLVGEEEDNLPAWRYHNGDPNGIWFYYYRITIGSKNVILGVTFEADGNISFITAHFTMTDSVDVELIF